MCETAIEVRLPTSKKGMPKNWFKNLLGAVGCLETLWSKKCSKCGEVKPLIEFHTSKGKGDGYYSHCKSCHSIITAIYYKNHKEYVAILTKKWFDAHKDKAIEYSRNWRKNNKDKSAAITSKWGKANRKKINSRRKKRKLTDINYKIECYIRTRVAKATLNSIKTGSSIKDLGCSVACLRKRLESMFWPGMTWKNQGYYGWHIDHDTPLASFNLENREQFLTACHYTNLQPLWHDDNSIKNNRLDWTPEESTHELPARLIFNRANA